MMFLRRYWVISFFIILLVAPVIVYSNDSVEVVKQKIPKKQYSENNSLPSGLNYEQKELIQKYQNLVNIGEDDGEILIKADDVPIGVLLNSIEIKTGMHFIVPQSIWNDNIKINLTVSNWRAALNIILHHYDRAGEWDTKLNLITIRLFSRNTSEEVQEVHQTAEDSFDETEQTTIQEMHQTVEDPFNETEQATIQEVIPSEKLTFYQLSEIANGRLRSGLSPSLFDDPNISIFLKQFGIMSIEDGQDSKKAMKVRVEARNRLRKMVD
jgi:hypothetical protein